MSDPQPSLPPSPEGCDAPEMTELLAALDELYPLPDDDLRPERAGRTALALKRYVARTTEAIGATVAKLIAPHMQAAKAASDRQIEEAFTALCDNGGTRIRSGLAASISMTLKSMNSTRKAIVERAEAAESRVAALAVQVEKLRQWQVNVTAALRREGGSFYENVPKHVRELRASVDRLMQENKEHEARLPYVDEYDQMERDLAAAKTELQQLRQEHEQLKEEKASDLAAWREQDQALQDIYGACEVDEHVTCPGDVARIVRAELAALRQPLTEQGPT